MNFLSVKVKKIAQQPYVMERIVLCLLFILIVSGCGHPEGNFFEDAQSINFEIESNADWLAEEADRFRESQGLKENQEYLHNVKVESFEAKYFESPIYGTKAGVSFAIKNDGPRILIMVEVTVFFKDVEGNTIAEETWRPVDVEDSFCLPLRADETWQMEPGSFYPSLNAPSEWIEGNAVARVTAIEFQP